MKLGEVCRIVGGGTPSKKISSYYEGDIPWATVRDMNCRVLAKTDLKITQRAVEESATNVIAAGEIVIATHVGLGKVCVLAQDTAINQDLKAIIPIGDTCRGYLYFWFVSIADRIIASGKGATVKGVTVDFVKNLELPLPPLPIQRKIAAELDLICELKRKAEEVVEKFGQLVKSKFVEMFGDVVTNDRGWTKVRFDEVTTSRLGKMLDAKKQTGKNKHKYLANFNVQWFRIDMSELHEMDFDAAEQIEFELRFGDLLVCEGGESGRCCVWRNQVEDCFYQKALHRVRCNKDKLDPVYLSYWFWFSCANHAFDHILGAKATIAHLPGVKLKALPLALPPLALQRDFAAFVARVEKLEAAAKARVEKFDLLYRAKLQEYFA